MFYLIKSYLHGVYKEAVTSVRHMTSDTGGTVSDIQGGCGIALHCHSIRHLLHFSVECCNIEFL